LFSDRRSLAKRRDENKKDQGALKALWDFVAKVPPIADHEIIRRSMLAKRRDENKKDQGALKALWDFVAKVPPNCGS